MCTTTFQQHSNRSTRGNDVENKFQAIETVREIKIKLKW